VVVAFEKGRELFALKTLPTIVAGMGPGRPKRRYLTLMSVEAPRSSFDGKLPPLPKLLRQIPGARRADSATPRFRLRRVDGGPGRQWTMVFMINGKTFDRNPRD